MKLLVSILLILPVFATTGLKIGNQLSSQPIEGQILLRCNDSGQFETRYVNCRMNYLSPAESSKFILDESANVDADKVKLYYKDHRGKTKSKSSKFDSTSGESKSRFNLWIATLLQRPLLNYYGDNEIEYKLYKGREVVKSGTFTVNVEKQDTKFCANDSYYSSNIQDCRSPGMICGRYFRDHNYCE